MSFSSHVKALCLLGAVLTAPLAASAGDPPQRVVSMNLCTDQLAMLVAGEGQLISVSYLAQDPRGSAMAEEAQGYTANHGLAEEIYLMQPDLVVAGRYTKRATTAMLQRLGIPVVVFDPASSLEDVRTGLIRMGEVLGREDRAAALAEAYDARLAALQADIAARPRAALYSASGYTRGDGTLAGQILIAAGFSNVATEAGYARGGVMPLEVLALTAPDAVITSRPYPGASRSEEILVHPVVRALQSAAAAGSFMDREWVCGTPHVLNAVAEAAELRRQVLETQE